MASSLPMEYVKQLQIKDTILRWGFVQISICRSDEYMIAGYATNKRPIKTSPVSALSACGHWATTKTGSLYAMGSRDDQIAAEAMRELGYVPISNVFQVRAYGLYPIVGRENDGGQVEVFDIDKLLRLPDGTYTFLTGIFRPSMVIPSGDLKTPVPEIIWVKPPG